jgi:hypothetical protein
MFKLPRIATILALIACLGVPTARAANTAHDCSSLAHDVVCKVTVTKDDHPAILRVKLNQEVAINAGNEKTSVIVDRQVFRRSSFDSAWLFHASKLGRFVVTIRTFKDDSFTDPELTTFVLEVGR